MDKQQAAVELLRNERNMPFVALSSKQARDLLALVEACKQPCGLAISHGMQCPASKALRKAEGRE